MPEADRDHRSDGGDRRARGHRVAPRASGTTFVVSAARARLLEDPLAQRRRAAPGRRRRGERARDLPERLELLAAALAASARCASYSRSLRGVERVERVGGRQLVDRSMLRPSSRRWVVEQLAQSREARRTSGS